MILRFLGTVGLLLAVGLPPTRAEEGKDGHGDPLPKGAKARLGTERMRNLDGGALLMPDGKTILSVSGGNINVIDAVTGLPTGKVPVEKGTYALQPTNVSANGKRTLSLRYDGLSVVELATGKKLCEIKRSGFSGDGMVSLSADGKTLALGGSADEKAKEKIVTVRIWDVDGDKEIAAIKVAQNNTGRVALSADGKTLVTWGFHYANLKANEEVNPDTDPNREVQYWDAATGKAISSTRLPTAPAMVAIAPDGQSVAIGVYGSISLHTTKTGALTKQLLGRSQIGRVVQFSGDGQAIAAVSDDGGAIQLWDAATGKSRGITEPPAGGGYLSYRGMSFPTKDRLVAFAIRGVSGLVWEVPSGKRLSPDGGHTEALAGLTFAAGDKEIIATSNAGQVVRWDPAGKELGRIVLRVPGSGTRSSSDRVQIAPGGTLAYTAESSMGIGLYDLPGGVQRFCLPFDGSYSNICAFSGDGTKVAAVMPAPYSKTPKPAKVAVYDIAKAELVGRFPLPLGAVTAAACTADGGQLAILRRLEDERGKSKYFLNGFDTATGKPLPAMPLEENFGSPFLAPAPGKGGILLVDPREGLLEIDLGEGKKTRTIVEGNLSLTMAPVMSPDGKLVALALGSIYTANPATIHIVDYESGKVLHKFTGHIRPASAMAFSKDGKTLGTGSPDTTILLWDLTAEKD